VPGGESISESLRAVYCGFRRLKRRRKRAARDLARRLPRSGLSRRASRVWSLVSQGVLRLGGLGKRTSSKPKKTPQAARKRKIALIRFGSAYGQCFIHQTPSLPPKNEPGPNILG